MKGINEKRLEGNVGQRKVLKKRNPWSAWDFLNLEITKDHAALPEREDTSIQRLKDLPINQESGKINPVI